MMGMRELPAMMGTRELPAMMGMAARQPPHSRLHYCTTALLHYCTGALLHYCTTALVHYCTTALVHKHCTSTRGINSSTPFLATSRQEEHPPPPAAPLAWAHTRRHSRQASFSSRTSRPASSSSSTSAPLTSAAQPGGYVAQLALQQRQVPLHLMLVGPQLCELLAQPRLDAPPLLRVQVHLGGVGQG
jgi:hypothetical protein